MARVLAHLRGNAVAYLALFVALAGTAYAAGLPHNSVGRKQLRNNAVRTRHVKNGSLLLEDLKAGQVLPAHGKAADSNLLDGLDPTRFVRGPGRMVWNRKFVPLDGNDYTLLTSKTLGKLSANCGSSHPDPTITLTNTTGAKVDAVASDKSVAQTLDPGAVKISMGTENTVIYTLFTPDNRHAALLAASIWTPGAASSPCYAYVVGFIHD